MSEQPHDLHTFMAQVTNEMASEYQRIHARTAEDPGTAGDEGEENWAALLRDWLPPYYHVATKGRLIGSDGAMSPQIDVLVLKPSYPKKLLEKKVWLAQGVAAVLECKTTIRSEHIVESAERCKAFKRLVPPRVGSPRIELQSALIYGILAHSHSWKSEQSKPVENVNRALEVAMRAASRPSERIDMVCIADVATWNTMDLARYDASWIPEKEKALRELFCGPWGVSTSIVCSAINGDRQKEEFRPIGAMIAHLTQRIAWDDPAARDLADYYRRSNLWGSGEGPQQLWPASIYSDTVRSGIDAGRLTNGGDWDDWGIGVL